MEVNATACLMSKTPCNMNIYLNKINVKMYFRNVIFL